MNNNHINTFNPKDYIVTKDGFRGYVVQRLDYCHNMYEIRLVAGLTCPTYSLTIGI